MTTLGDVTDQPPAPYGPPPAPDLAVPAGPGVVPPFPAPPVEGRGARVGAGIGIGAAVLLLLGGGGAAAVAGLYVTAAKALDEQLGVVVDQYYSALRDQRYEQAYLLLCDTEQDAETSSEFAARERGEDPITSFSRGSIQLAAEPVVPVELVRDDGTRRNVRVVLTQDPRTGKFEVCGVEG